MIGVRFRFAWIVAALALAPAANAQLDPVRRDLVEAGYGRPLEGHMPLTMYGYYYLNRPQFRDPDIVLQTEITPVYVNGELGIRKFFGPDTDLGIRIDGGGFAYGDNEFQYGRWSRERVVPGSWGRRDTRCVSSLQLGRDNSAERRAASRLRRKDLPTVPRYNW